MSKEEDIKIFEKRIREVKHDLQRALFDNNYELAAHYKRAIKTLEAQRDHLKEISDDSETS